MSDERIDTREEKVTELYHFFLNYVDPATKEYKYKDRLHELPSQPRRFKILRVDFDDLVISLPEIAMELSRDPRTVIEYMQEAAYEALANIRPLDAEAMSRDEIHIAIVGENAGTELRIRDISSAYVGRLITISGLLVKLSQVYLKLHKVVYVCTNADCNYELEIEARSIGEEPGPPPKECPICEKKNTFRIDPRRTIYKDVQFARIQEKPEELPPGQIPRFIDIVLEEPLIDVAYPGEYVRVVGILDIDRIKSREARYQFRLVALSMESLGKENVETKLTKKDIEMLKEMSKSPDFYDKILRSFSPSIYGHRHVKEALLLAIIGADDKVLPDGNRIRGRIHVLLVGDPGVAKSQLLKYAVQIAPKGIYTSGRGSTAAGLTAAVIKDPGGGMSLEAGAVVLADMGICAIDEIDKMRNEDRVAIHEAMEQLTVSVSKGGIIATLNARTTIIAAANPKGGRYNPHLYFTDNVNLPPTLISRFDIIHLMRDIPDPKADEELIDHIIMAREGEKVYEDTFSPDFLKKYILYAKRLKPVFTEEAYAKLKEFFLSRRKKYDPDTGTMPITNRQFEALIRIAEASAKAHLREVVTVEDAEIAINQLNKFLREVAFDEESQEVDVTSILVGQSKKVSKVHTVLDIISEMQDEVDGNPVPIEEVIKRVVEKTRLKDPDEIARLLDKMHDQGLVTYPQPGLVSIVGKRRKK